MQGDRSQSWRHLDFSIHAIMLLNLPHQRVMECIASLMTLVSKPPDTNVLFITFTHVRMARLSWPGGTPAHH